MSLIADPVERQRVHEARQQLRRQSVGTKWHDTFTVCDKRIRSSAIVTNDQTIVGVDQVIDEYSRNVSE